MARMRCDSANHKCRHGGYRASLTKAMMVYNWLSALDTSAY